MCQSSLLEKGLRVLVVDSHADSTALLSVLFAEYGIEMSVATSASEALELMQQTCPDLLISEIFLPGEDGYSLISKVKAFEMTYRVQIPSIALTACFSACDRISILAAGFCKHLPKPLDIDELMSAMACLTEQAHELTTHAC